MHDPAVLTGAGGSLARFGGLRATGSRNTHLRVPQGRGPAVLTGAGGSLARFGGLRATGPAVLTGAGALLLLCAVVFSQPAPTMGDELVPPQIPGCFLETLGGIGFEGIPEMIEEGVPETVPVPPASGTEKTDGLESRFQTTWEKARPALEAFVSPKRLRELSRWAKHQMASFVPAPGWAEALRPKLVGRFAGEGLKTGSGKFVFSTPVENGKFVFSTPVESGKFVFSTPVENGFELPSHSPIVFRRLVVWAVFDDGNNRIEKIIVSIRGWREE